MTKKKYIHLGIMLLITLLISICPTIGSLTPLGMRTLAIFIAVLYGWMTVDLIWPSIYGFVMLALLGIMDTTTALMTGLGNSQIVQVITVMVVAGAFDASGVTKLITNWMLTRKLFRKQPWLLICGLVLTSYVLGLCGVAIAAVLILWSVVLQIADEGHFDRGDKLITFIILMIAAANFSGVFSLPFHASTMIFEGYFIDTTDLTFSTAQFILVGVVTTGLVLAVMLLCGKFVFRMDASKFRMPEETIEKMEHETIETRAKIGFVTLIVYMLCLVVPSVFPNMPGASFAQALGIGGWSLLALLVLAVVSVQGKTIIDLPKTWTQYIDWSLLLLLSVTFPLADAMRSEETGIMSSLMAAVMPVVSEMSLFSFMVLSMILLGSITQFAHNIVLAAMFTPFLIPICIQLGGNPYVLFFLMFFSLNASYCTPAASFQSAMVHGFEATNKKYAYIFGIVFSVLTWIVLTVVTIPLAGVMFPY
ncbi:MAG: SLC13 family permease [Peptococcaceae bacterium]|nr:SLC13 family permease [Peptococcaceae bacterium]